MSDVKIAPAPIERLERFEQHAGMLKWVGRGQVFKLDHDRRFRPQTRSFRAHRYRLVRSDNEDCFGYSESHGIYVVCDGMGGMASVEVASAAAVSTILETFSASAGSGAPVITRLLHAVEAPNRAVWRDSQTPEHRGMGTTVAAALDGNTLVIGNVGDSLAYMVYAGQLHSAHARPFPR